MIITICIILLMSILSSCEKTGTFEPLQAPPYKWDRYILDYSSCDGLHFTKLYAGSGNDVYALATPISCVNHNIFHFDGKTWKNLPINISGGGLLIANTVFGWSSVDIWFAGFYPIPDGYVDMLWHYDGVELSRVPPPYIVRDYSELNVVYGDRPDNMWAGGSYGTLYHYDGDNWKRDSIHVNNTFPPDLLYQFKIRSITGNDNYGFYLNSSLNDLHKYDGNTWNLIDTDSWVANLYMSPSGTLYGDGNYISKWDGKIWYHIYPNPVKPIIVRSLHIIDDNQIYAPVRVDGVSTLVFFNGLNWIEYPELRSMDVEYYDIIFVDGELFILGQTLEGRKVGVILHGKPSI